MRLTGDRKNFDKKFEILNFGFFNFFLMPLLQEKIFDTLKFYMRLLFLSLRYDADLGRSRVSFLNVNSPSKSICADRFSMYLDK